MSSEHTPVRPTDEAVDLDKPVEGDFLDLSEDEWEDFGGRTHDQLNVVMLRNKKTGRFMISAVDLRTNEYFSFSPENSDVTWALHHPQIARDKYAGHQVDGFPKVEMEAEEQEAA